LLVIFSDIHLTDESTAVNVAPEAFDILSDEIRDNAINKKAKEVRIILLGDIFDLVRTDHWLKLQLNERPWNGKLDKYTGMNTNPAVETHFNKLLTDILETDSGKAFIKMLNEIKKPVIDVPVIITYVIGNHDRAFNNYDSLKSLLTKKLNGIDKIEFVNSYFSNEYATLCRHGNEYDENNYGYSLYNVLLKEAGKDTIKDRFNENIYKVITIGEVITCELMSGLIYRVNNKLKDKRFTKLLMDLNNVRPMLNMFSWLYWYGKDLTAKKKNAIMNSFIKSLKAVVETDLANEWTKIANFSILFKRDLIDNFKILLKIVDDKKFDEVSKYIEIAKFKEKHWPEKDYCKEGAKFEWGNPKYENIQHVFFGHTHESRNDFFEGKKDNIVKMYINTGTYLPYITQTEDGESFAEAYQMTMAFVYSEDEDKNGKTDKPSPSLDIWNGIKRKNYKIE
jgi:UDP-2,3-diacylglucosamine pyrophosphatase LpxH